MPWGDGVATTYPTYPQFRFLLGFRPLYFVKRHANVFFKVKQKNLKNRQILKGIIPLAFMIGGTRSPSPHRGAAYDNSIYNNEKKIREDSDSNTNIREDSDFPNLQSQLHL